MTASASSEKSSGLLGCCHTPSGRPKLLRRLTLRPFAFRLITFLRRSLQERLLLSKPAFLKARRTLTGTRYICATRRRASLSPYATAAGTGRMTPSRSRRLLQGMPLRTARHLATADPRCSRVHTGFTESSRLRWWWSLAGIIRSCHTR
ncbi:hypothetical protein MRX96_039943 [Rhipicephalus microplus]